MNRWFRTNRNIWANLNFILIVITIIGDVAIWLVRGSQPAWITILGIVVLNSYTLFIPFITLFYWLRDKGIL